VPVAAMARMRSPSSVVSVMSRPAAGFVEQQHGRVGDAGQRDRHELAFALAQLAGRPVTQADDPEAVERPEHRGATVGGTPAEGGHADVLLNGEVVVELELRERAPQAGPNPRM
jgi:hypothetical protein